MQYKVLSCRFGAIPYFEPLQFAGDLGIFVARVLKGQKTTFWEAVREVGTMGQGRLDDSVAEVLKPLVIEAGFAERAHETEYEINQLLSRLIISACSKTGDIRDRVEAVLTGSSEIRELYDTLDEHRD
ncbi:hypothetical protein HN511_02470, partial [bacterium]|nr:hypothetical protein [bacterium]